MTSLKLELLQNWSQKCKFFSKYIILKSSRLGLSLSRHLIPSDWELFITYFLFPEYSSISLFSKLAYVILELSLPMEQALWWKCNAFENLSLNMNIQGTHFPGSLRSPGKQGRCDVKRLLRWSPVLDMGALLIVLEIPRETQHWCPSACHSSLPFPPRGVFVPCSYCSLNTQNVLEQELFW